MKFEPSNRAPSAPDAWWPPDFLVMDTRTTGEENSNDPPDTGSHVPPEDLPGRKLADAYHLVGQQREHIADLKKEIEALENEVIEAQTDLRTYKRTCRSTLYGALGALSLTALLLWHREMGQVGWDLAAPVLSAFRLNAEELVGLLVIAGCALTLLAVAKATFSAALEEIMDKTVEKEEDI